MERVVILAGNIREANAYCVEKGIRGTFAQTPAQVHQATKIIKLAGFGRRRDRYALSQASDNRLRFSKEQVEYVDETSWAPAFPPEPVKLDETLDESYDHLDETAIAGVYELDLTDEAVLEELKAALNKVGYTLRKLPTKDEAPVVDAPVEF